MERSISLEQLTSGRSSLPSPSLSALTGIYFPSEKSQREVAEVGYLFTFSRSFDVCRADDRSDSTGHRSRGIVSISGSFIGHISHLVSFERVFR